jgi:hypothetical protein
MQWVFPLTPAGEYERLVVLINKAEPGDMPDFSNRHANGLQRAQGQRRRRSSTPS